MKNYELDYIDGKEALPLVITADYNLIGDHHGTVHVENGTLTISGKLHGTLDVQRNSKVIIMGEAHGTVLLENGTSVIVYGAIHGTTVLNNNSTMVIEDGAKLSGTLVNNGKVILKGTFGGSQSGRGELTIEGNGYIKQPVVKNGVSYYQW